MTASSEPTCPRCGERGRKVYDVTPRTLLVDAAKARLDGRRELRFCKRGDCDVVYFGEGGLWFGTREVRVPVFQKSTARGRFACYCFAHTVEGLEDEVRRTGGSEAPDLIAAACRQSLDRCEETNPQGSCCLGNVRQVVKTAVARERQGAAVSRCDKQLGHGLPYTPMWIVVEKPREAHVNDAAELKRKELATWTRVVPGWMKWDEVLVRCAAPVSARILEMARIGEGQRVLDIASGTGEPALAAATRVGSKGSVLGVDFVEPMLAFAREKAGKQGLSNIVFRCVDGEELDVPAQSFDAVTIRWGLMFMPDPLACLSRCRAALKSGGHLSASCWAEPQRNPWAALPAGIVRKQLGLPAPAPGPGLFAFSDPERLKSAVAQAGFSDVQVVDQAVGWGPFDSAAHALTFISELAGPVAALMAAAPDEKRAVIEDEIRRAYAAFEKDARVVLPGVTWIVSGTRD
ncbi:MAG: class I SAM-dependent methyltransferase [Myxococcota bacterium]